MSSIEWTNKTWNPVTGCSRITDGCDNCYMFRQYPRLKAMGVPGYQEAPDVVTLLPERLDAPMRWTKPSMVFVNSMSDLFHPDVPDAFIDRVFAVMAQTPEHTYQVLTKRPARAARFTQRWNPQDLAPMPLPNVWIGVSVTGGKETGPYLDQLARINAAVRFVSYEPALAPFDFTPWLGAVPTIPELAGVAAFVHVAREILGGQNVKVGGKGRSIDWLIVGGESGPDARPFHISWAESAIDQGKRARVPVFVKQMGAKPYLETVGQTAWRFSSRKGGDPAEWPESVRVREFPRSPSNPIPASVT